MGVEKMACCGELTRVYSDSGNRKHAPTCPTQQRAMTESEEIEILRSIVKRTKVITWWARLSYPRNPKYWTPEETQVLLRCQGIGKETKPSLAQGTEGAKVQRTP